MSINEYIAGAFGGVAGIVVGHPFDTTKIQMQIRTTGDHRISKSSEAWVSVAAQGLRKGLFRGMMFPVMSYALVNSTFFGVYGSTIKILEPDHTVRPTNMQVFLAGCFAGSVQLTIACPMEVIKCTLQAQIPLTRSLTHSQSLVSGHPRLLSQPVYPLKYHSGPFSCWVDIVKTEGVRGLYKGISAMFVRDVPGFGLYLLVYEWLHKYMTHHGLSDAKGVVAAIVAGGFAGSISWAAIMPFDVIKSRLQVDHGGRYTGFWDCTQQSVRNAGVSVLFRGMGVTLTRAFPVNAVTFLVYSQLLNELNIINPPCSTCRK